MKRFFALLLAALMLLTMTACGGNSTAAEPPVETDPEPTKEVVTFLDPKPSQRPDYSLPENPTEQQLRETAVRAMRDMLTIQFSVPKDFMYNKEGAVSHKDYIYKTDTVYAGMPYADGQVNIFVWHEFYDSETGRLRMDGDGQWLNSTLGNTCAGSLMWGWSAVSHTLTGSYINYNMTVKNGVLPVGTYTYDPMINSFHDIQTSEICKENGMATMFESYAMVKMADAVTSSTVDHTMMAIEDATVVRYADGGINPSESYIIIQDQAAGVTSTSEFLVYDEDGIQVHYTGRTNVKWTFLDLYKSNYIPVTTKEFAGEEPYVQPEVKINSTVTDFETLYGTTITSVYPMSMIKIMAKKSTGRETELFHYYVNRMDVGSGLAREYKLSGNRLDVDSVVKELIAGDYTITLEVTDSTGEVFNLASFSYSK